MAASHFVCHGDTRGMHACEELLNAMQALRSIGPCPADLHLDATFFG